MTDERVIEAQSQEPSQTPVLASAALSHTATPNNPLLRHEPQVVDMLFDRVPMGVAILDSSFSVLRYNPTWADFVAQYTPSHAHELAQGVNLFSLAPGFRQTAAPLIVEALEGRTVRRDALKLQSEGITSYWDITLMPLVAEGEVLAIVLMTTDATERVLMQQTVEQRVAAERNRLARDLHDSVTQTLFSASLVAEVLPKLWELDQEEGRARLQELRQLTRGALAEMRMLLFELRPRMLTEVRLSELLRQLAEATSGRGKVQVQLCVEDPALHESQLSPDVQIALYRIAQEALNNVARHSQATHARVLLTFSPQEVELRVSDNGRGFDSSLITAEHIGLNIMQERAQSIGARLTIRSQPGTGTLVVASWDQGPGTRDQGSGLVRVASE